MNTAGYLTEIVPNEGFRVFVPFPDTYLLDKRKITEVGVDVSDGRTISHKERSKIYATLGDISSYSGHTVEELKDYFKVKYMIEIGCDWFSLSNVDVTTANGFLEMLINHCLEWDIPTNGSLADRSPDISRYLYSCLINKRCAVCGKKSELHHADRVGAGRNRREITHIGMRAEALCRIHHTEAHTIGQQTFDSLHHVYGIKLDEYLCEILKIKRS